MRKFILRNENGSVYNLNNAKCNFIYKPNGLGYSRNVTAFHTMNGNYAITKNEVAQPSVGGEFVITNNPYNEYRTLLAFITGAKELYLGYSTTADEWLYLKGVMQSIAKTELDKNGLLRCSFRFLGVSPWRKENPVEVNITTENEALTYDKVYDYTYGDESASGAYSYTASGHIPAAIELRIPGPVVSPVITLTRDSDSEVIGLMSVSASFQEGEALFVSTIPSEAGVWKETANGRVSLISSINLENNNFFEWETGTQCTLTLSASGSLPSTASLKIYEYYGSV